MGCHFHSPNLPIVPRTAFHQGPGLLLSLAGLLILGGVGTGPAAPHKVVGLGWGFLGQGWALGWVLRTGVAASRHTVGTGAGTGGTWPWCVDGREEGAVGPNLYLELEEDALLISKRFCEDLGAQTWDTRRGHNNPGRQVQQVKGSLGQCDFTRLPTPPRAVVIVLSPMLPPR